MESGEGIGDPAANVVSYQVGGVQAEVLEQLVDVLGEARGRVAVLARSRPSHAPEIDRDNREGRRKPRHHSPPFEPVLRKAV